MLKKWTAYFLTLVTYAAVNSCRVTLASLKAPLNENPFRFEVASLGVMDMMLLFSLALAMTFLGAYADKLGPKKALIISLKGLLLVQATLFVLTISRVVSYPLYLALAILTGVTSCLAWPCCLSILSCFFKSGKSPALPLWNGCNQLANFSTAFVNYIIIDVLRWNPFITVSVLSVFIAIIILLNAWLLPEKEGFLELQNTFKVKEISQQQFSINIKKDQLEEEQKTVKEEIKSQMKDCVKSEGSLGPNALEKDDGKSQNAVQAKTDGSVQQSVRSVPNELASKRITIFNVWCLPNVFLFVLVNGLAKSVNVIMTTWLIYSLGVRGIKAHSNLLLIIWSVGVFFGGYIGSKINPSLKKGIFFAQLLSGVFLFAFTDSIQPTRTSELIIVMAFTSICFGGPYNLFNTAVPIMLVETPGIKELSGAKAVIISVMESTTLMMAGVSVLLVPFIGVSKIFTISTVYCGIAAGCLALSMASEWFSGYRRRRAQQNAQYKPNIMGQIQV